MLSMQDRGVACAFKQELMRLGPVIDVRVYGSRARGDAAPDSDLDVFIELETVTPALRRQISEIAWEVGFRMDRVISTLVVTQDQLEHGAQGANPMVHQVLQEGVSV